MIDFRKITKLTFNDFFRQKIHFKDFLFKNIGVKQIIAKNTLWLGLAETIARVSGLILAIYMAKILGVTEYGKFTFAFSFTSIMAIFADLGIIDIATREFSRDKENENKFYEIFSLEIVLSAVSLLITFISSLFITSDPIIRKIILVLTFFMLSNSFIGIIFSVFRARQKMEYEAGIRILQTFLSIAVIFLVIFSFPSVVNLSYAYLLSNLTILILILIIFYVYFQPIKMVWKRNIFEILKKSWPLSLGFMSGWIYIYIDSIMLGYFGLITENGWFNAASKIAIAAIMPASLTIKSFYPALSNFYVTSFERLQRSWDYFAQLMILLAMPIVTGGVILSPFIINTFYGSNFFPAILAFQMLIIITGISFITFPYSVILVVADQQKKNFFLISAGAILNIILNFILVPLYNFYGVIIATIISSLVVLISTMFFSTKVTHIHIFDKKLIKTTLVSVFASFVMYLSVAFILPYRLNIIIVCLVLGLVYVIIVAPLYKIFCQ